MQGTVLGGRYRLEAIIGQGGMGTVWQAHDTVEDTVVAVKQLSPEMSVQTKARRRFENEARAMMALAHPNIVGVRDVSTDDAQPWMVMDLVAGGSLRDRMKATGPIPPKEASTILQGVLTALSVAHERGIVHRDIKPDNILLDGGVPRVTDFGIARIRDDDQSTLTRTGAVMGTWAFMAPEQRSNAKEVGPASDVYSVGATLYAMLTNAEPLDLYTQEVREELSEGLPDVLGAVIRRATHYKPDRRFQSAEAMRAHLAHEHERLPDRTEPGAPAREFVDESATFDLDAVAEDDEDVVVDTIPDHPPRRIGEMILGVWLVLLVLGGLGWLGTSLLSETRLTVDSHPSAVLKVDGEYRGKTPWSGAVEPGAHTIMLNTPDGRTTTHQVAVEGDVRFCWSFDAGAVCR